MRLQDRDLVELHGAFAAQVLACEKTLASDAFARQQLGRDRTLGELDSGRMNVNGGAIALEHPVGGGQETVLLLESAGVVSPPLAAWRQAASGGERDSCGRRHGSVAE